MRGAIWALAAGLAACRPGSVAERAAALPELCEDYCAQRVMCVADGWAKNDAQVCRQMCANEERYAMPGACGEASFALLECMAALTCEELPRAVEGLAQADASVGCYAEQVEQRELCSFEIVQP